MKRNRIVPEPNKEGLLAGIFTILTELAVGAFLVLSGPSVHAQPPLNDQIAVTYGRLPLHFELNHGQADQQVKFLYRDSHETLFLTPTEAVLVMTKADQALPRRKLPDERITPTVLHMAFLGSNPTAAVSGQDELVGKVNYFIGNDPEKWRTDVPTYAKVHYQDLYPKIDLSFYGNKHQLEYDFIIRPGGDPQTIVFQYEGIDQLGLDAQGNLVLHMPDGAIHQQKPFIYQEVNGTRQEILGGYVLRGPRQVGFQVAAYDTNRPLIIDPTLLYSTYLGGSGGDQGQGIAVDAAGNAYVTGFAFSANFPTTAGSFQPALAGSSHGDAIVTKLNPTGSALVYSTYLGGSTGDDNGGGIAVDTAGNAYVTGRSRSSDFPTTSGAFQTVFGGGCCDAYVTKLNPTGSGLVFSTYLGGSLEDAGEGIGIDSAGNAYVAGVTAGNFPTTAGAFQTAFAGAPYDAFVTQVNSTGSGLVYSTYLGGTSYDQGNGIAIDATGNVYVTGVTAGSNFPVTAGAFQITFGGGCCDAFVTQVNSTGSGLVYSTYLGGSTEDIGNGIAVDAVGNAYIAGLTGGNFPTTAGAFQMTFGGGPFDAFATKLTSTGSGLVYSTYLGGSGDDEGFAVAVDGLSTPNTFVTGQAGSLNFPTINPVQAVNGGGIDVFVTQLNPTGSGLVYSTYLGGINNDLGTSIAVDNLSSANAYVTGVATSTNFPVTSGVVQATYGGGGSDAFVAKIAQVTIPSTTAGKVTGGGTIDVAGLSNFGFVVQSQSSTGPIKGDLQFVNRATGEKMHSLTFDVLAISGNTATFGGTCTNNGAPCSFAVNVIDNGEPGTNDAFTISISGGPLEGGVLRSGNIQIH